MDKPKRPYYVTPTHSLGVSSSMEYEIGWAKWVVMHNLLGYAMIEKTEIRRAYEILNRERGNDESQRREPVSGTEHKPVDGA